MRSLLAAAILCLLPAAAYPYGRQEDGVDRLVAAVERAVKAGDEQGLRALIRPEAIGGPAVDDFTHSLAAGQPAVASVKERDRAPIAGGRQRLMLEILVDRDGEGRLATWRVDVAPGSTAADGAWGIVDVARLSTVTGLFRLSLDASAEYDAHNLVINMPDLKLTLPSGRAFVARSLDGPTALVLLGSGQAQFSPKPAAERGQVRIFCGSETLDTGFSAAFVRINPHEFGARVESEALTSRRVDAGDLRHAGEVFDTYVPQSFQINLNDLSTDRWSLVPSPNDLVAEIVTKKYGTLTYARSSTDLEDVSLFDRRRHRNIAVYASETKLRERGPFYSEDDTRDYDITDYYVETAFSPERLWLDGTTRVSLTTRNASMTTLTLRLADPLVVRSVSSPVLGRLLHLRIVGQNSILIGLPMAVASGTKLDLVIAYSGRLTPQSLDREAVAVEQDRPQQEQIEIPLEPQFVYSNRSYWYPQGTVTDYATATIGITVPAEFEAVASGEAKGPPTAVQPTGAERPRKRFVYEATEPVRYLACVISRFQSLRLPGKPLVQANPREFSRARSFAERASDIMSFYGSLVGDSPYRNFTIALTESDVPGGHSPGYFAILNQALPTSPFTWQNDPVSFQNYADFFLAHEVAHQWWGQAVGWNNYHEQWLSEGFAQYFAALYGEHERGPEQFAAILRQMRRTAIDTSPQGPVSLGYRLGHIKGEGRVFRAIVYNKGAMVLHMLRRLVGDEAFFSGLRQFYDAWRFKKAGTQDFRAAMEKTSGASLGRFFDGWIYGSTIPSIRASSSVGGSSLHVVIDQDGETVFEFPLTVTITYADGSVENTIVPVRDQHVDRSLPLKGAVRAVDFNRDNAALVNVRK
jgi:peptidase M1-like protein